MLFQTIWPVVGHTYFLNKFLNSKKISSASEHSDKTGYFVLEAKIGLTALTSQVNIIFKYADRFQSKAELKRWRI